MANSNPNERKIVLLARWQRNCQRSSIGNYDAANIYTRRNYFLGIPAALLSAIVGTSVFAALGKQVDTKIQITVGGISVLAAVLGSLQTFLKWGELASKHRAAAAEYNALKRFIDQILARQSNEDPIDETEMDKIRIQMDTLARDTPELPAKIWADARKKIPLEEDRTRTD